MPPKDVYNTIAIDRWTWAIMEFTPVHYTSLARWRFVASCPSICCCTRFQRDWLSGGVSQPTAEMQALPPQSPAAAPNQATKKGPISLAPNMSLNFIGRDGGAELDQRGHDPAGRLEPERERRDVENAAATKSGMKLAWYEARCTIVLFPPL